MRDRIVGAALLIIALAGLSPVWAQQAASKPITITVTDPTGAGVAHAQIRLVPAPDTTPGKLEADDRGHLSLHLKPGSYAVLVSAQGFKKAAVHVDVTEPGASEANATASQIVPAMLQVGTGNGPVMAYTEDSLVLTAESYHKPVVLSAADFRVLPHVAVTVHNVHTNADETYSAVPLATLLAMINAPIGGELHGEALATYLVATGTDGYSVVLSIAEADPSFHGGQIVVADARDGQPLGKSGPFQLIVSDDKRPARWVHNLAAIALQSAH